MTNETQNNASAPEELITRISQVIKRKDGSEVKITAQAAFGAGLTRSIDVYVLRRDNADSNWQGCSNRPKAGWRNMSVGNDSNLFIVFYVQIMPDDFVMQLHRF